MSGGATVESEPTNATNANATNATNKPNDINDATKNVATNANNKPNDVNDTTTNNVATVEKVNDATKNVATVEKVNDATKNVATVEPSDVNDVATVKKEPNDVNDATKNVIPDAEPATNATNNATKPDVNPAIVVPSDKCVEHPTLLSSADPECIRTQKVALETIVQNAVNVPFELTKQATAEGIVDVFKSSGNDAIAEILTKEALPQLTDKDGKLLNEVLADPAVAKEFDKFQNNLSGVVGKSLENLSHNIEKPLNDAVETAIEGSISTATHAAANAPGVGAIVTIAEAAGTVNKLKEEASQIVNAVEDAKLPIDNAMKDIVPLSNAIDEAAKNAIPKVEVSVPKAPEIPKVEVPEVSVPKAPEIPKVEVKVEASRMEGGSRKRRRIHKLSRRIERTLRRVQKKYGLQDDKNDFLRRTLRKGAYVPPQTPRKGQ